MYEKEQVVIFVAELKNRRKNNNLSQEKLSFIANVDRTAIGRIERGQRTPSLLTIFKIANALNLDLMKIFS